VKDPYFLGRILPLSFEVVDILSRIFELDPSKRITIPELRSLIVDCPSFTTVPFLPEYVASSEPQTLPHSLEEPLQMLNLSPEDSVPKSQPDNPNHMLATSPLLSTAEDDDRMSLF
jgi:serine/threonine protein kinase